MKRIFLSLFLLGLGIFASCINTKYIYSGNTLYRDNPPKGTLLSQVESYELKNGIEAKVVDNGEYLIITPVHKISFPSTTSISIPENLIYGRRKDLQKSGEIYFPEKNAVKPKTRLTYFDSKPILQTLTVPIKYRNRLKNVSLLDSFPSNVETGININLAVGWKINHNIFSSHKNIFNQNTNRLSLSGGALIGFGGTDLSKANTRNPIITFPRKAFTTSIGGFAMLGFNNLNLGYAFGWDSPSGQGSGQWLYKGRMWHGIAIGFDIIK